MTIEDRIAVILGEWHLHSEKGEAPDPAEVIAAHPDLADALQEHFAASIFKFSNRCLDVMSAFLTGIRRC